MPMNIKRNASSRPWQARFVKAVAPQHREATVAQAVARGRLFLWAMLLGPALTIVLLAAQASGSSAQSGWHIEVVDAASFLVGDASLALDPTGRPHISFTQAISGVIPSPVRLRDTSLIDAAWLTTTVDDNFAGNSSMAAGAAERLYASYHFGVIPEEMGLRLATRSGNSWGSEVVESAEGEFPLGLHSSLALDSNEAPHISYTGLRNNELRYAHREATTATRLSTLQIRSWRWPARPDPWWAVAALVAIVTLAAIALTNRTTYQSTHLTSRGATATPAATKPPTPAAPPTPTITPTSPPTATPAGPAPPIQVAAGGSHTCAVIETDGIACWGYTICGQLGDGSTQDRTIPVHVAGFGVVVRRYLPLILKQ